MSSDIVDVEPLYAAVGGKEPELLEAYVERQIPALNQQQQGAVMKCLTDICYSRRACSFFGIDYDNPQYTPLARAYAVFEALRTG
ncbi:MAG TPA: hypothetical protein VJI15_02385 [Candidatus Nanoarchaeia archaeon]|nr:hypothetical protein [Candidatus Nanoarchaeia archaeon]